MTIQERLKEIDDWIKQDDIPMTFETADLIVELRQLVDAYRNTAMSLSDLDEHGVNKFAEAELARIQKEVGGEHAM